MQAFIRDRFTSYSIKPVLIINEIDHIRRNRHLPNPNFFSLVIDVPWGTIESIRDTRELILARHREALPDQLCDQSELCRWVQEIQDEQYTFFNIASFLTQFQPTERSPDGPDEYDFIAFQVIRKFNLFYSP